MQISPTWTFSTVRCWWWHSRMGMVVFVLLSIIADVTDVDSCWFCWLLLLLYIVLLMVMLYVGLYVARRMIAGWWISWPSIRTINIISSMSIAIPENNVGINNHKPSVSEWFIPPTASTMVMWEILWHCFSHTTHCDLAVFLLRPRLTPFAETHPTYSTIPYTGGGFID